MEVLDTILDRLKKFKEDVLKDNKYAFTTIISENVGVIIVNSEAVIFYSTPPVNKLFGYETLEGMTIHDLVPASLREAHKKHFGNYLNYPHVRPMGSHNMDLKGVKKDGTEIQVKISLTPVEILDMPFVIAQVLNYN